MMKTFTNKLLPVMLALALVFAFGACAGAETAPQADAAETAQADDAAEAAKLLENIKGTYVCQRLEAARVFHQTPKQSFEGPKDDPLDLPVRDEQPLHCEIRG